MDIELTRLRRRFLESGAPEDEAAFLAARVRHGDVSPDALDFAARLGSEAARRVTGAPEPEPLRHLDDAALVTRFPRWDQRARLLVAALEELLGWWQTSDARPPDEVLAVIVRCVAVTREWLGDPDAPNELRCLDAARRTWALGFPLEARYDRALRHLAWGAAATAYVGAPPGERLHLAEGRQRRSRLWRPAGRDPDSVRDGRTQGAAFEVFEAVNGPVYVQLRGRDVMSAEAGERFVAAQAASVDGALAAVLREVLAER